MPTHLHPSRSQLYDVTLWHKPSSTNHLAVDDEAMLLDVLANDFESRGYNVIRAATSVEALEVLEKHAREIDLLVTDIRLPGPIDGWTIAERARRLRPDLPVIYVTGFFSQMSREVSGGTIFMKPYRLSSIAHAAEKLWSEQGEQQPSGN